MLSSGLRADCKSYMDSINFHTIPDASMSSSVARVLRRMNALQPAQVMLNSLTAHPAANQMGAWWKLHGDLRSEHQETDFPTIQN